MDITLGADNKMDTLAFHWVAFFKDGSYIPQYSEGSHQENLFKEVQDNFDDLSRFTLRHRFKDIQFTVDINKGVICSGLGIASNPEATKNKKNIRLIFFRRHTVELSEAYNETGRSIRYFLGYQYNDEKGENHKVIVQIDSDGNFAIGE